MDIPVRQRKPNESTRTATSCIGSNTNARDDGSSQTGIENFTKDRDKREEDRNQESKTG